MANSSNMVRGVVLLEGAERVAGRWKHVTLGSTYSNITFSTGGTVLKVCSSIFIPKRIKSKIIIVILTNLASWWIK